MKFKRCTYLMIFVTLNLYSQFNIRFEEIKFDESQPQNAVFSIHKDKLGFLWLGTYYGLNRYDGYTFKVYKTNEDIFNKTSNNKVTAIHEDRFGKLWVGTYDSKIYRFDPKTERYQDLPFKDFNNKTIQVTHFYQQDKGFICISTNNQGIYLFIEDSSDRLKHLHIYNNEKNNDILTDNKMHFTVADNYGNYWSGSENGLNRIRINNIKNNDYSVDKYFYNDKSNSNIEFTISAVTSDKIWFGTKNNGLFCFDNKNNKFIKTSESDIFRILKSQTISSFKLLDQYLWIGTISGLLIKYNISENNYFVYKLDIQGSGKEINSISIDSFNQLWIQTEKYGIVRFDIKNQNFKYYSFATETANKLPVAERTSILEDSENNLWLSMQNIGLLLYNRVDDNFISFSNIPDDPNSLSSNIIECLYQDDKDNIWIGTNWFGSGLNRMLKPDPAFKFIQPYPKARNLIQNFVRSLFQDSNGNIWAGTKNGEIFIYDQQYNLLHIIRNNKEINFTDQNIYNIYEDNKDEIWICTKGTGIFKSTLPLGKYPNSYKNLKFQSIKNIPDNENSLSNDKVYDLVVDKLNRTWVATYGGGLNLIVKDKKNYKFYEYTIENSSISSNRIRDLYLDYNGRLWMGTVNGLNYLDIYMSLDLKNPDIKLFRTDTAKLHELSYSDIIMLTEDKFHNIWVTTASNGFFEIYKDNISGDPVYKYKEENGLVSNNTVSILESYNGFIWIGTNNGLARYNPTTKHFVSFNYNNGLPTTLFSEQTCIQDRNNNVLFGTNKGLYVIIQDKIEYKSNTPQIYLTGFHLFNKEVLPAENNSPLKKSMPYTKNITLKYNQSNFALEFVALTLKNAAGNQYMCIMEGFEKEWNYLGTQNKVVYNNLPPGKYCFRVRGIMNSISTKPETHVNIEILKPIWKTNMAYIIYLFFGLLLILIVIRITIHITTLKNNLVIEKKVAETKLKFFTNISHEFKTPLTLILAPLEDIIKRKDLHSELKQQLLIIHRNSKRLLRLISQLLDFRKIQNDKVELNIENIKLIPFVYNIYENFREVAKQKKIKYDFQIDNPNVNIWGDIQKLEIVFFNLLSNAFKFTDENNFIQVIVNSMHKDYVEVICKDTGMGISSDKIPFIFERFSTANLDDENNYGSGIGLSLVNEYVKLHNGIINVTSDLGKGTSFSVILPKNKSLIHFEEKKAEYISNAPEEYINLTNITETNNKSHSVLIVEDDLDMLSYLSNILQRYYNVFYAKDGEEGYRMAIKKNPDIIITDLMMPKSDGIELTKKLKQDLNTSHIPVIILTAKNEKNSQINSLMTGALAYLSKPFENDILFSYISTFLEQKRILKQYFGSTVELKPDEIKVTPKDKVFIKEIIERIEMNLSDSEFNVERLTENINLSRSVFNKKVKSITGYSPVELIRLLRLKRAHQLLTTKEYNVNEVAFMVGFADARYFSTCFNKQFDIKPSELIK